MTTLTVGSGKLFTTIKAAVAASARGDTILIDAGVYVDDFVGIYHDLTLKSVGGTAHLRATVSPPNGKAIIDVGGPGVTVTLAGLELSGAAVPDGNGAGVRYEGGTLTLRDMNVHHNEDGLLANSDPNGSITITGSNFHENGSGTGYTHNIYVGSIAQLTVRDSTITGVKAGHNIKSRAAATTITGNVIADGSSGTASYEIDLSNGGVGVIRDNYIQKGAGAQNPIAITFGAEGNLYATSSLAVTGNTIVNELSGRTTIAVVNKSAATATVADNQLYGWTSTTSGPAAAAGNTLLAAVPVPGARAAIPSNTVDFTDVTLGRSGQATLSAPDPGGPSYLKGQFIWSSPDSVAIATSAPSVFLKGGTGSDALRAASGENVLDGGSGSNFLVGGTGTDTFFVDSRGGKEVWNTVVNFGAGDATTLWGFVPGTSTYSWDDRPSGADGYLGATLRANVAGRGLDASVTFTGLSVAQGRALQVATGTVGGSSYLYLYNPGV